MQLRSCFVFLACSLGLFAQKKPITLETVIQFDRSGARGQTAAELARVVHLEDDPEPQDAAATGLRLAPASGSGSATFRAPNTVWIQAGLPVRAVGELHAVIHPNLPRFDNSGYVGTCGDQKLFHPGGALAPPDEAVDVLCVVVSAPWMRASTSE